MREHKRTFLFSNMKSDKMDNIAKGVKRGDSSKAFHNLTLNIQEDEMGNKRSKYLWETPHPHKNFG